MRGIGPFKVYAADNQLIGNLWQDRATKLWTAYNKVSDAPLWTKHGPASRAECREWLVRVAADPTALAPAS